VSMVEQSDIVQRLRTYDREVMLEAADAIEHLQRELECEYRLAAERGALQERLQRDNDKLRAALVDIADPNCLRTSESFREVARRALAND
jgi:hypothetical protein